MLVTWDRTLRHRHLSPSSADGVAGLNLYAIRTR